MAYKNRFGGTDICKRQYNRLSISWDYGGNPDNEKERYPVLLFVPNEAADEHYHIELNRKQAEVLHKWLGQYIYNGETRWKK